MANVQQHYTPLPVTDVAYRCGLGSRISLYFAFQRAFSTKPSDRCEKLRRKGTGIGIEIGE